MPQPTTRIQIMQQMLCGSSLAGAGEINPLSCEDVLCKHKMHPLSSNSSEPQLEFRPNTNLTYIKYKIQIIIEARRGCVTFPSLKYLRLPLPPLLIFSPESRNSALSTHTCSRDDCYMLGFGKQLAEFRHIWGST